MDSGSGYTGLPTFSCCNNYSSSASPSWGNYQLKPGDIPSKGNRQALTKVDFYLLDMEITSCTKHRSM